MHRIECKNPKKQIYSPRYNLGNVQMNVKRSIFFCRLQYFAMSNMLEIRQNHNLNMPFIQNEVKKICQSKYAKTESN